jgi:hypothetical protein
MFRFLILLIVLQVSAFAQTLRPGVYDGTRVIIKCLSVNSLGEKVASSPW